MLTTEAKLAAISGTRAMIAQDEFFVLTEVLVRCGAVPKAVMAAAFQTLAGHFLGKASGEIETDWMVCPAELRERAATLRAMAGELMQTAAQPRT